MNGPSLQSLTVKTDVGPHNPRFERKVASVHASPFDGLRIRVRTMRPPVRPPARFSVVAAYGRWFARPAKTPVTAHPEGLQGHFGLNEKYFLSGFYLAPATTN